MPRFTIKDLLLATTLIAIGMAMLPTLVQGTLLHWIGKSGLLVVPTCFIIWLTSGVFIGAGLFTPFKKVRMGIAVGFFIQFILALILIFFRGIPI